MLIKAVLYLILEFVKKIGLAASSLSSTPQPEHLHKLTAHMFTLTGSLHKKYTQSSFTCSFVVESFVILWLTGCTVGFLWDISEDDFSQHLRYPSAFNPLFFRYEAPKYGLIVPPEEIRTDRTKIAFYL